MNKNYQYINNNESSSDEFSDDNFYAQNKKNDYKVIDDFLDNKYDKNAQKRKQKK